ncbi:hypothetical protein M3J09_012530 [Ascochyta lentis]
MRRHSRSAYMFRERSGGCCRCEGEGEPWTPTTFRDTHILSESVALGSSMLVNVHSHASSPCSVRVVAVELHCMFRYLYWCWALCMSLAVRAFAASADRKGWAEISVVVLSDPGDERVWWMLYSKYGSAVDEIVGEGSVITAVDVEA